MCVGEYTGAPEVQKTGESVPRRILGAGTQIQIQTALFSFRKWRIRTPNILYASDHAWAIALRTRRIPRIKDTAAGVAKVSDAWTGFLQCWNAKLNAWLCCSIQEWIQTAQ